MKVCNLTFQTPTIHHSYSKYFFFVDLAKELDLAV